MYVSVSARSNVVWEWIKARNSNTGHLHPSHVTFSFLITPLNYPAFCQWYFKAYGIKSFIIISDVSFLNSLGLLVIAFWTHIMYILVYCTYIPMFMIGSQSSACSFKISNVGVPPSQVQFPRSAIIIISPFLSTTDGAVAKPYWV